MGVAGIAVHRRSHAAQPSGWSATASMTMVAKPVVRKGLESVYQVGSRWKNAGPAEHRRPAQLAADYGAGETWTGQV
jgi:hypothetical protein